jgi:ribonuclease BN (tRNA processing enzyme)
VPDINVTPISVTFLGTNGWYSSDTGNTLCILVDTPDTLIILDAGDGFHKIPDLYPHVNKPAVLFISHLHLDHISGLHTLARCKFEKGLKIYCIPGNKKYLIEFIGYPYTVPISELSYNISIEELPMGISDISFPVKTALLEHTQPVYGYWFDVGRKIAFCTDTGPCQGIIDLGSGTDLLITECSYLPGQENSGWPHMNPEIAISYARKAGTKRLALVHFAADLYTSLKQREMIKENYLDPAVLIIGRDDLKINL